MTRTPRERRRKVRLEASFEPRAIVVADRVGYSRWLARQPVATYAALTSHLRHVFEPTVRRHSGTPVKNTGDGIFAIFKDAGAAEDAARAIQRLIEQGVVALTPVVGLRYRVAVHYGDVMVLRDDVLGIAVNAAAHMQGLTPPGGIFISGALFKNLKELNKAGYAYAGGRYPHVMICARSGAVSCLTDLTWSTPFMND